MGPFIDARSVPSGTAIQTDLAIIGGGPSGIALALALSGTMNVTLIESGAMGFEPRTQALYRGVSGAPYLPLETSRLRFLGGSSNHWGGWCRPFDLIDFAERDWLAHSGWPIGRGEIEHYFAKAHQLCEAGTPLYDRAEALAGDPVLPLGPGGLATRFFQFSKTRDSYFPTHFGERYAGDLKKAARLAVYLHANVTRIGLHPSGKAVDQLDIATLSGKRFTVKPRAVVLAAGAMENARLLLASNDINPAGVGNSRDLVGRFFADHPTPRDIATIIVFNGKVPSYYGAIKSVEGGIIRGGLLPGEDYRRTKKAMAAAITIENKTELDAFAKAAVAATASALGVDSADAAAYALGCGMEISPDPDRRLVLDRPRDALGMARLKLKMTLDTADFDALRQTLTELGRQLLAARTGMIKLNLKTRAEWIANLDWGNHHMGTTRMSADPVKGVVDANLKLHEADNLYIAGSSVFPTYGAANPTVNLLALTLRLADHLKTVLR